MNRRKAMRNLFIVSAGSFVLPVRADNQQKQSTQNAEEYTLRSESRLVILDVSVTDRAGASVSGLTKANFKVSEDGKPQPITVFEHNDAPVTIGILIDESQSMSGKRNDVLVAAGTFIADSNRQDEIFVVNFNDRIAPGLASPKMFSDNVDELRAALYRGVPRGRTALNDAIANGLLHVQLGTHDKKALIIISDGGDNASHYRTNQVFDMVDHSTVTIYTIGLFDADEPEKNPGVLRRLARSTGGEAYFPATSADMKPVCHRIAQDIRARYTVGYLPPAGSADLRRVHVQLDVPGRSGLTARTRKTYHYDAPKA